MTKIYYCETPGGTEIKDGGDTTSRKVLLSVDDGPPNSGWEMVRNLVDVQPFQLNSSGAGTVPMDNLDPGMNLFDLREHSSASPISRWLVNVKEVTAELTIDRSLMVLDGVKLIQNYGWISKDVARNTDTRLPMGGVAPYFFVSRHPTVATVTPTGKVSGMKNGATLIDVTDSMGRVASFPVFVANVSQIYVTDVLITGEQAFHWIVGLGGNMRAAYDLVFHELANNFVDVREAFSNATGEPGRRWATISDHVPAPSSLFGWAEANNATIVSGAGPVINPGEFPDPTFKARAIAFVLT